MVGITQEKQIISFISIVVPQTLPKGAIVIQRLLANKPIADFHNIFKIS